MREFIQIAGQNYDIHQYNDKYYIIIDDDIMFVDDEFLNAIDEIKNECRKLKEELFPELYTDTL